MKTPILLYLWYDTQLHSSREPFRRRTIKEGTPRTTGHRGQAIEVGRQLLLLLSVVHTVFCALWLHILPVLSFDFDTTGGEKQTVATDLVRSGVGWFLSRWEDDSAFQAWNVVSRISYLVSLDASANHDITKEESDEERVSPR